MDRSRTVVKVRMRRPVPWILLLLAVLALALIEPQVWRIWSVDPPVPIAHESIVVLGLIAVWLVLRGLTLLQIAAVWACSTDSAYTSPKLIETVLARTATCALVGTFLALMTTYGVEPDRIKATALLSDLATVGALVGIAACGRTAVRAASSASKRLRSAGWKRWIAARAAVLIVDVVVVFHVVESVVSAVEAA